MNNFKIFIVEDDPFYGELIKRHLSLNPENEVYLFKQGKGMLANIHQKPDLITLDYSLPDMTGMDVLKKIKSFDSDIPVIIVSGQEDVNTAVELLRLGAYDYFVKDDHTRTRIWNSVLKIRENLKLRDELNTLKEEVGKKYEFNNILKGNSPGMLRVFDLMSRATKTQITVSITGETGTGKELVAKAIHYNSYRAKKPFVAVNVSAIPHELIESELFGYEKGAFTGANVRKIGKFEQASEGTLFLDEIGEMDLAMQAKILRVIQEKELTRIGGNTIVKINPRIIVATHRNLQEEVKKGNFREDLYYRILGLPIELPPLRERGNDILLLAKYFVDTFCNENGMNPKSITPEAQNKLLSYGFPGNVRELKAIMELACVLSDENVIDVNHMNFNTTGVMNGFLMEETTLAEYNKKIIRYFLNKYDNNVNKTAQKLDIGKSTIYRMLKNNEL
jgi:DNA-binding NtrC family response regulator